MIDLFMHAPIVSSLALLELFTLIAFIILVLISLRTIRKNNVRRFSLLVRTAKIFRKDQPLKKAFPIILKEISEYVKAIKASGVIVFSDRESFKVQSLVNISQEEFDAIIIPKHILRRMIKEKTSIIYSFKTKQAGYRGMVICPLQVQDTVVGAFVLLHKKRMLNVFYSQYLEALTYQISLEFEDRLLQTKLDAFSKGLSMVEYSYEKIVDNLPTGVTVIDPQGRILLWNKRMSTMSGQDVSDMIGQDYAAVFPRKRSIKNFLKELATSQMLTHLRDYEFVTKKTHHILEITGYPLFDMQDQIVAYVIMHWDVTGERKLEQTLKRTQQQVNEQLKQKVKIATKELIDANTELQRLNTIKSEFVSVISHELKTPLTSIKGYVALLLSQKLGDVTNKQKEALSVVDEQSDRLAELINDVLDLSRLESGKTTLKVAKTNVCEIIEKVTEVMKPQAQHKKISVQTDCDDNLEIQADQMKLRQVFMNLLSNAIKFTNEGGTISITAQKNKQICTLAVKDTGIGMDAEQLKHVFEPFYQVEDHMTRNVAGTGLGLTIVKHITELHKGSITVQSKPEQGTTFTITLPVLQ